MTDRLIPLEGVLNFRDFGGYAGADGRAVSRGRLFRSAHLARASARDLETIGALDLALVADLRRPLERAAEPGPWGGAGRPRVLETALVDGDDGLPPHAGYFREETGVTSDGVRAYMLDVYARIPFVAHHAPVFTDVFRSLAEEGGPLLVHCAAGKDRTGVLCALILDALGVDEAAIVADYEMTNHVVDLDRIAAHAAERASARYGVKASPEAMAPMACVSADYLAEAWRAIREQCGSLAAYRRDVLGVTPEAEAGLRARLLAA